MDMEKIDDTLKLSHLVLLQSCFQSLPPLLKNILISQEKKILPKKPYLVQKFAQRLARNLNEGDLPWIAKDTDLLFGKINNLPRLVSHVPLAKRAFKNWQRAIRNHGPLSLEKSLTHYRKILLALLNSSKITDEERTTIEVALIFVSKKGLRGVVREVEKNFPAKDFLELPSGNMISVWRLPNGKRMRSLSSDFKVKPHEDENEETNTPANNRIGDTAPYDSEGINAQDAYNNFDLEDEVKKVPNLTRLEKRILLLKSHHDISLKEVGKELRIKSATRTYYSARKKMDRWLKQIGMKEILQSNGGRTDPPARCLFNPPFKTRRLPSLWDDETAKSSSPVREWFADQHDQNFLSALIPPEEEKPWCW